MEPGAAAEPEDLQRMREALWEQLDAVRAQRRELSAQQQQLEHALGPELGPELAPRLGERSRKRKREQEGDENGGGEGQPERQGNPSGDDDIGPDEISETGPSIKRLRRVLVDERKRLWAAESNVASQITAVHLLEDTRRMEIKISLQLSLETGTEMDTFLTLVNALKYVLANESGVEKIMHDLEAITERVDNLIKRMAAEVETAFERMRHLAGPAVMPTGSQEEEENDDGELEEPYPLRLRDPDGSLSPKNAAKLAESRGGGWTALHRAAWAGPAAALPCLLAAGAAPDQRGPRGTTALHLAARAGHAHAVERLLAAGANPGPADDSGRTPLYLAALAGREDAARRLLAAGASAGPPETATQRTALHVAAAAGHLGVAELLLAAGADPRATDLLGNTALHLAAELGHEPVLRALLEAGAEADAVNAGGATALRVATWSGKCVCPSPGQLACARTLLEAGARPVLPSTSIADDPALWPAAEADFVRRVVQADPEFVLDECAPHAALRDAASWGRLAAVQALLEAGVNPNGGAISPLRAAAEQGHADVVRLLLAWKADPEKGIGLAYPMLVACEAGHVAVVRALLDAGVDPNLHSPLAPAVGSGRLEVVQLLLSAGARANDPAYQHRPLLHLSVLGGHQLVVLLLLSAGARLDALDWNGQTALHLAADCGKPELARLLLRAGADPLAVNRQGQVPLELAREPRTREALRAAM